MDQVFLYLQIVEAIRNDIYSGKLKPGAALPSIRKMTQDWNCTTGTMFRAYQELARQNLIISQVGRGTRVVEKLPAMEETHLRRALLFNQAEAFLLEVMSIGYSTEEVENALHVALDRWRIFSQKPDDTKPDILRFVGSHDPSLALIASQYHENNPQLSLQLSFTGSLGGLIALAENKADLAGSHLWDEKTDTYNEPFIRKLLPGQKVAMLTLAHRHVGLILPTGNPLNIHKLADLTTPGVIFVNRQQGSGTRVWLDAQLRKLQIDPALIAGIDQEKMTHSDVARAISKSQANAGIGVETVALYFGLDFIPLTTERYDLVIPAEKWETESIQILKNWLETRQAKSAIGNLGGYDTTHTGEVTWVS